MQTFEEALAATNAAREHARQLSLKYCEQKKSGTPDPQLSAELQQACDDWDNFSAVAVKKSTSLDSFRLARRLAPEDGQAWSSYPEYLDQRLQTA